MALIRMLIGVAILFGALWFLLKDQDAGPGSLQNADQTIQTAKDAASQATHAAAQVGDRADAVKGEMSPPAEPPPPPAAPTE